MSGVNWGDSDYESAQCQTTGSLGHTKKPCKAVPIQVFPPSTCDEPVLEHKDYARVTTMSTGLIASLHLKLHPGSLLTSREGCNTGSLVSEFLCTIAVIFLIVFPICLVQYAINYAVLISGPFSPGVLLVVSILGIMFNAFVAGFALASFSGGFGTLSGAIFNPHLTLLYLVEGKIKWLPALLYVVIQFAASCIGAVMVRIFFPTSAGLCGLPVSLLGFGAVHVMLAEIIGSTIFFSVVLFGRDRAINSSLVDGMVLLVLNLVFGPISGASFNFWRYMGSAICSGTFTRAWAYFVGPLVGGFLAWLFHYAITKVFHAECTREKTYCKD